MKNEKITSGTFFKCCHCKKNVLYTVYPYESDDGKEEYCRSLVIHCATIEGIEKYLGGKSENLRDEAVKRRDKEIEAGCVQWKISKKPSQSCLIINENRQSQTEILDIFLNALANGIRHFLKRKLIYFDDS